MRKKIIIPILVLLVATIGLLFIIFIDTASAPDPVKSSTSDNPNNPESKPEFDKKRYSTSEPDSIWVVVNKKRPLPDGYAPTEIVVPDVKLRLDRTQEQMHSSGAISSQIKELFDAASRDNVNLVFGSGYRSEQLQKQFYNQYVAQSGQTDADTFSARPGYSEHQTGLAFDVTSVSENCHLEICFEDTPEGIWVAKYAYKYGFVVRYQKGKEKITGYQYEPWHLRYVGKELASELQKNNQTMEEFFGLGSASQY